MRLFVIWAIALIQLTANATTFDSSAQLEASANRKFSSFSVENTDWNSAQNCQISPKVREPQLGPWRNQHERGWCYANSAAEMATVACGRSVSAADIALNAKDENGDGSYDGGDQLTALRSTEKKGFCAEDDLPQERFVDLEPSRFIAKVKRIEESSARGTLGCHVLGDVTNLFGFVRNARDILVRAHGKAVLQKLADQKCKPRFHCAQSFDGGNLPYSRSDAQRRQAVGILISEIKRGSPAAVGLDISDFTALSHEDYVPGGSLAGVRNHALTATSIEFEPASKKCLVKLRDSYGGDCKYIDRSKARCELGSIWIPVDKLAEKIIALTYIKKPGVNDSDAYQFDDFQVRATIPKAPPSD